jgi:hypothetical protein
MELLTNHFLQLLQKSNGSIKSSSDFGTNEVSTSSARSTVAGFIVELAQRAKYGIGGEKPLAVIAALKYLRDNRTVGKELLELLEEPHSRTIRSIFFSLAKHCGKVTDPSSSWGVITGKNRELQNAVYQFRAGDVNKAFSQLKPEEIENLLKSYLSRLDSS